MRTARNINSNKRDLSPEQREELLGALKARFEKNRNRREGLEWAKVQARLEANAEKLWSLHEMERTGGEPDVLSISWSDHSFSALASSLACTLAHSRPSRRFLFFSKRAFNAPSSSSRCSGDKSL